MHFHGYSKTSSHPLYWIWRSIKARCYNEKCKGYKNYGGRGVIMWDGWLNNSVDFIEWSLSNGWRHGLQIDKDIKAKEHGVEPLMYSPDMCIFVTCKVNANERRGNRILEFNGQKLTISQWADKTGIPRNAIRMRIESHGYTIEQALTSPHGKQVHKRDCFKVEFNGRIEPLSVWAKELGATPKDIGRSLKSGKSFEYIYNRYKSGKKRKDAKTN